MKARFDYRIRLIKANLNRRMSNDAPRFHRKIFKAISNTPNGHVGKETLFYYEQYGDLIQARYTGGAVAEGRLLAKELASGELEMLYHHLNTDGELIIGECRSRVDYTQDGRIKLLKQWQWLCGDRSSGYSELVESGHW